MQDSLPDQLEVRVGSQCLEWVAGHWLTALFFFAVLFRSFPFPFARTAFRPAQRHSRYKILESTIGIPECCSQRSCTLILALARDHNQLIHLSFLLWGETGLHRGLRLLGSRLLLRCQRWTHWLLLHWQILLLLLSGRLLLCGWLFHLLVLWLLGRWFGLERIGKKQAYLGNHDHQEVAFLNLVILESLGVVFHHFPVGDQLHQLRLHLVFDFDLLFDLADLSKLSLYGLTVSVSLASRGSCLP